jgi:AcrR family transcriptional regulator
MTSEMNAPRRRDREATQARFVAAALRVLARDGASALGINTIAAEAGADKKLIYRYFGGLDGLLRAIGERVDLWAGTAPAAAAGEGDYAARMTAALEAYGAKLRGDPLLQRLLVWELSDVSSAALQVINAARSQAMQAAMPAARAGDGPPEGVDAPAVNAILLAALNYLTLRRRTLGGFAGLDISTPEGEARLGAAFRFLLERAYRA